MADSFYKFPSTPHLAALGGIDIRNDKVMSEDERRIFLEREIVVEEKIDGANLGVSFDASGSPRFQNRGQFIHPPFSGQWKTLLSWMDPKMDVLFDALSDRYILFGEWCYAQHSLAYNRLPDWFIGFDLYDKKESKFLPTAHRNTFLENAGIFIVPQVGRGVFTLPELLELFARSRFGENSVEGLYLRLENDSQLCQRAKLVQKQFIQSIGAHWAKGAIKTNFVITSKG